MGYFQVRYNSRVVIYERKMFKRLATHLNTTLVRGMVKWLREETHETVETGSCGFKSQRRILDGSLKHLYAA